MATTNTDTLRDLVLTPRAVAALVSLRKGPRSIAQLADAIGDLTTAETGILVSTLCGRADAAGRWVLLERYPVAAGTRSRYGLTHDGLGWLQCRGLDATPAAKQALYGATDARALQVVRS